ncbi:hypothetical protein [Treponema sp.]|uniref:hypothetical protein n=1 Tax=Treponema sp. TaxID=166 RepID=UPI003FD72501
MKSRKAKLNVIINTRVNEETGKRLESKAFRENMDVSSVVREIIGQYFEDTLSDSKILFQNVIQVKRKISMLENKMEIMSMLIIQLAQAYTSTFPDRQLTQEMQDKFYEDLIKRMAENMKNHKGKLESMVLDIYEQSGSL